METDLNWFFCYFLFLNITIIQDVIASSAFVYNITFACEQVPGHNNSTLIDTELYHNGCPRQEYKPLHFGYLCQKSREIIGQILKIRIVLNSTNSDSQSYKISAEAPLSRPNTCYQHAIRYTGQSDLII